MSEMIPDARSVFDLDPDLRLYTVTIEIATLVAAETEGEAEVAVAQDVDYYLNPQFWEQVLITAREES